MTQDSTPHSDPHAIAQRIRELRDAQDREIEAQNYQAAAAMLDERKRLLADLERHADPRLLRNLEILSSAADRPGRLLLIDRLLRGPAADTADADLARTLSTAPASPVRWVLLGQERPPVATLRQVLDVESVTSAYFAARLAVLSQVTLKAVKAQQDLLRSVRAEASRGPVRVVWTVADLRWLAGTAALDAILEWLTPKDAQFVVCAGPQETNEAKRFVRLGQVTVIRV
jgi:hypothetical protein